MRKNLVTLLVILVTVVLAFIAIVSAVKLYQTRQAVAPNAPASRPAAAGVCNNVCSVGSCPTGFTCMVVTCGTSGNYIGTYSLHGTQSGTTFDHTMTITSYDSTTGAFSGTGFYNADHSVTWTVTGQIINNTNVTAHVVYTGTQAGYTSDFTGTIGSNGVWTGTTHDSLNVNGTETITALTCANTGICRNPSCLADDTCLCAGVPTPTAAPISGCQIAFNLTLPTATPTIAPTPTPTLAPTATPTIAPTPTPTPTPTSPPVASCANVRVYDTSWNLLTGVQIAALTPGTQIYFTVMGTTTSGNFDMARFVINGVTTPTTTNQKPGSPGEFYYLYTIPSGVTSFTVVGQLHLLQTGQWL